MFLESCSGDEFGLNGTGLERFELCFPEVILIDFVNEFDASNEVGNVVMAAKSSPASGRTLSQFEHHCDRRFGTAVALRLSASRTYRRELAFDGIGRPNVAPVLSREVNERPQHAPSIVRHFTAASYLADVAGGG